MMIPTLQFYIHPNIRIEIIILIFIQKKKKIKIIIFYFHVVNIILNCFKDL